MIQKLIALFTPSADSLIKKLDAHAQKLQLHAERLVDQAVKHDNEAEAHYQRGIDLSQASRAKATDAYVEADRAARVAQRVAALTS